MRYFYPLQAAILFAVPSASFTSCTQSQVQRASVASKRRGVRVSRAAKVPVQEEIEASSPTDAFTADAFTGEEGQAKEQEQAGHKYHHKYIDNIGLLESPELLESDNDNTDIIRDLEGYPLSKEYFARAMGIPSSEVESFREKDAFRDLNSNACRVHLLPGGQTAFYKHIVFSDLAHAHHKQKFQPHKLVRDVQSYQNVAAFLTSQACHTLTTTTGVHIPKCYHADLQPNFDNPIESKFSFLLEDLAPSDGWHQQWLLHDMEACQAALTTYAKMHAFFWTGAAFWNDNREAAAELEAGVWKSASYVQPKFQSENQYLSLQKEWAAKRIKFEPELSSFDYWDNLGERLQSIAQDCGHRAHPFAYDDDDDDDDAADDDDTLSLLSEQYNKYRTFTHGDPKQANMMFRRSTETKQLQVGLIDFQWAGFGLAASDISHFLTSAVHADRLVNGGEDILLRYYFDELQKYLVEYGAFETPDDALHKFSYDTFIEQYETGVLDICRLMIAYTWSRFDEPVEKEDLAACARTMNKTSYNKSIPNIVWLLGRCDEIMKSRGC